MWAKYQWLTARFFFVRTVIKELVATTRELFPEASRFDDVQPWAGLRPATPTGLPIIGRLPGAPHNLLLNTGHGALGFTLAFGSAQRVAALCRTPLF